MSFGFLVRTPDEYTRFVKSISHCIQHDGDYSILSLVDFVEEEKSANIDYELISLASMRSTHSFHASQY